MLNDTLKLKGLMCFMAATPTDCAEISFHTWSSLSLSLLCVCVSISLVSSLTLQVCLPQARLLKGGEWEE